MLQRTGMAYWGLVVLLVVSVAQAVYWTVDQVWFANAVVETAETFEAERLAAAHSLWEQGLTPEQIEVALPGIRFADGTFEFEESLAAGLDEERRSRINRYLWEGGFFLLVLCGTLATIASVLRRDARLRRRQENFLAAVSHEFKSPLASARLANETMAMRELDSAQQKVQLERALRSLDRLDGMVDNLLDSARIESGNLDLRPTQHFVAEVLEPIVANFGARAEAQNTTLDLTLDEDLEVLADEFALSTVVSNLIDNALRATAETDGGAVNVTARQTGRQIELSVRDNGEGFPPDGAESLFEKFYRPGDEMRRTGSGAGLGLYIVRGLMQLSGGEVTGTSDGPGRGATFTTTWPSPEVT